MYENCECFKFGDVIDVIFDLIPNIPHTWATCQLEKLGQLASVTRLFAQSYTGTRKSLQDFWPPLFEQPIKFVLKRCKMKASLEASCRLMVFFFCRTYLLCIEKTPDACQQQLKGMMDCHHKTNMFSVILRK